MRNGWAGSNRADAERVCLSEHVADGSSGASDRVGGLTSPSHSHGEGFLRFFEERCQRQGIFIFDEPELVWAGAGGRRSGGLLQGHA
jgi:predicted ATPase